MGKKQKQHIEFRYYEMPQGEDVLALLGESWRREYGKDIKYLHFHNMMEIGYCIEGEGEMVFDNASYRYRPGAITIVPKLIPHTTNSPKDECSYWEYLFIEPEVFLKAVHGDTLFTRDLSRRINEKPLLLDSAEYPALAQTALAIMNEMRSKQEFYRESVRGLLQTLLMEIARRNPAEELRSLKEKATGKRIDQALRYVDEHYSEPIRIETLAEVSHMSQTHFRRLFMDNMNMTPVEYLNLIRVERSCELMRKTNLSMELVAEQCGFVSQTTFNRNFVKLVGVSPYKWKRNAEDYGVRLLDYKITALKGW